MSCIGIKISLFMEMKIFVYIPLCKYIYMKHKHVVHFTVFMNFKCKPLEGL